MIDFVVDLVEERVDLGGSQFSESILERWYSAHASQQNVVVLEFWSPCSPRSALFAHDLNCHDQQRVSPFFPNVECFAFMTRTCSRTIWHIFCVCSNNESPRSFMCLFNVEILTVFRWTCLDYTRFNNGSPRSFRRNRFFVKRINIDLLRTGRFFFHLAQCSGHPW